LAIEAHRQLGPGLLESIYEECLCHELTLAGISFERQYCVPIEYKKKQLTNSLRLDLLVEDNVIVEIKSVNKLESIHTAQLLSY
jgi:GxxExxY protein